MNCLYCGMCTLHQANLLSVCVYNKKKNLSSPHESSKKRKSSMKFLSSNWSEYMKCQYFSWKEDYKTSFTNEGFFLMN